MFKIINTDYVISINEITNNYHGRDELRDHSLLKPDRFRKTSTMLSLMYRGPKVWNLLPDDIRSIQKIPKFKFELKFK